MTRPGFDALLFLSFGGPEKQEDVLPFLKNVTRGRGIPDERLMVVGEHYKHFHGRSPLNDLNREMIRHIEQELSRQCLDLPVYFGNRNWHPMANDTAEHMSRCGVRNALVFATSAWAGYSGCRQYSEDISAMQNHLISQGLENIRFTKLRQFFDHPLFIAANVKAVREACALCECPEKARLVFTAHSIPTHDDDRAGLPSDGALYSSQVRAAATLVAKEVGHDFTLVWQSRSGAAHIPWLEPDIVDWVIADHEAGSEAHDYVVCPIGFLSDHIEVIWDLDTELHNAATKRGIRIHRARTIGPSQDFARMVVALVKEQCDAARGVPVIPSRLDPDVPLYGCNADGAPCAQDCCIPPKKHPHRA